jgi:hypothetical protein
MSAKASKSCVNGTHGIVLATSVNDAPGRILRKLPSISPRRTRIAAISAAEMRAPPRFARLRSRSSNELGPEESPAS